MIYLIIKSYLILFFFIIAGGASVFLVFLYLILKPRKKRRRPLVQSPSVHAKNNKRNGVHITSQDIKAIAGDDVFATQLDLARAYIETGKEQLAKRILEYVIEKGNTQQRQEARNLLGST
jgi:pilus assembly protein FimV